MGSAAFAQNPCNPCGKGGHTFYVNDPRGRNTISFTSEAPLEDIVGTSNQITGKIVFDPMKPDEGGTAMLSVPASSFTTGIPLRDEHVAAAPWLNSGEHPEMTLNINAVNSVKAVSKTDESASFDVAVMGDLSIAGKSNPVTFTARVTFLKESEMTKKKMDGNLLAVRAKFSVSLAAYGIAGPPGMDLVGTKVGEDIQIAVSFVASDAAEMAANPCGGKKPKNPCNPCGK